MNIFVIHSIGQVKYLLNIWCKICAYWTPAPPCHYELMYRAPMRAKNYHRIKKFTNFSSEITLLAYRLVPWWFSPVWVFAQISRNFELAVYRLSTTPIRSQPSVECWPYYTCILYNSSFTNFWERFKRGLKTKSGLALMGQVATFFKSGFNCCNQHAGQSIQSYSACVCYH